MPHNSPVPSHPTLRRVVLVAGILLPPLILLSLLHRYLINFPKWDDWAFIYGVLKFMPPGTWNWDYLMARHGIHLEVTSKLLYYGLGTFAHWDLTPGIYAQFVLGALIFFGLAMLIHRTFRGDPAAWLFYPLASLCSFNLVQWPLFFSPWGICWLALSVILRLSMLWSDLRLPFLIKFVLLLVFAVTGSFCLGAGYALWLAIPLYIMGRGTWEKVSKSVLISSGVLWVLACVLALVPFLRNYHEINHFDLVSNFTAPEGKAQISPLTYCLHHPLPSIHFFLLVLGAPCGAGMDVNSFFGHHLYIHMKLAFLMGVLSLLLFSLHGLYVLKNRHLSETLRRFIPWICIGVFELVIAALVTIGRVGGWDLSHAIDPHYSLIAVHFQLTVCVTSYLVWRDSQQLAISASSQDGNPKWLNSLIDDYFVPHGKAVVTYFTAVFVLCSLVAEWVSIPEIRQNQVLLQYEKDVVFLTNLIPDNIFFSSDKSSNLAFMAEHQIFPMASKSQIDEWLKAADLVPIQNPIEWVNSPSSLNLPVGGQFGDRLADGLQEPQTLVIAYLSPIGQHFYDTACASPVDPQPAARLGKECLYDFTIVPTNDIRENDPNSKLSTIQAVYVFHRREQKLVRIY